MNTNNSTSSKAGNNVDGKSNQIPVSSTSQRNPKSVVPQLMDIYDDLKQSSTPQTTTLQLPQNHMPKGVYYSGSHKSFNSLSHTNQRNVGRKRSSSQFSSGGVVPATTTSGTAKSRKSTPNQVMANETEEYNAKQQASRKKGKTSDTDQRWSKRFSWPDELHRDFVSAVFDVGLKHSSPSAIMEFMRPNPDVTSERVKSRLQKYRKNREKSRNEFMASYDSALERFQRRQQEQNQAPQGGQEDVENSGHSVSGGEAAALCTHASFAERIHASDGGSVSLVSSVRSTPVTGIAPTSSVSQLSQLATREADGVGTLHMPLLTTEEKDGHIGQSFGYLVGLYQSLSRQLEESRRQGGANTDHVPSTQVSSYQSQTVAAHQQHEPQPLSQYQPPQQHVYHQRMQPNVEQAVATAASMHTNNDPSIHEVAASIPHACMMGSQPTVQPTTQHRTYPVGRPPTQQQHHHHAPLSQQQQQQQYSQVQATSASSNTQHFSSHAPPSSHEQQYSQVQATAESSNTQHYSSHAPQHPHVQTPTPSSSQHIPNQYNSVAVPSIPQGEYISQMQHQHMVHQPRDVNRAPAPQSAHAHQPHHFQRAAAPSPKHHTGEHNHHRPHPGQQYLPENSQAQSHQEMPTVSHHSQQQPHGQPAFVQRNPLPQPRVMHQPGPPQRNATAPAMHHPSVPQQTQTIPSAPPPQAQEQHEMQHHTQHHLAPAPHSTPSHPNESAAPATSQPTSIINENPPPLPGTGRTLQAQKESTMMKQEMQGQMVFQNKIRALKQIELSKYGGKEQQRGAPAPGQHTHVGAVGGASNAAEAGVTSSHTGPSRSHQEQTEGGTGTNPAQHQLSEALDPELFWSPEDDDQIFDFLMEN